MVDLQGKDKGNISLPARLQSPEVQNSKNEDDGPLILNMQIAMYEARINDLRMKIKRLQARNQQLDSFFQSVKNTAENGDLDAEKEVVDLNNDIASMTKKCDDIKKKYDEVAKRRENRKNDHLEQVKQMEEKFEKTRIEFYSEIKIRNAKVNSIEEFKQAYEGLKAKYDGQNESYLQKENEMNKILNQIEFKTKMHRESLKKEAYKQILEVSDQFQTELKSTVPMTVQRLMRENIVLENELVRLWNDYANMETDQSNTINGIEENIEKIKQAKRNMKRRLITSKIQNLLLKKVKAAHAVVKAELSKLFHPPDNFENNYLRILENIANNPEFSDDDFRRRKLEVLLHREKINLALAHKLKEDSSFAVKKSGEALSKLKSIVNSALLFDNENIREDFECMDFKNMDLETLACHLLNVIEDCDSKKWITETESVVTVTSPSNVYTMGDLGFDPKPVEINGEVEVIEELPAESTSTTIVSREGIPDQEKEPSKVIIDVLARQGTETVSEKSIEDFMDLVQEDIISEDMFEYEGYEYDFEMDNEFYDYMN